MNRICNRTFYLSMYVACISYVKLSEIFKWRANKKKRKQEIEEYIYKLPSLFWSWLRHSIFLAKPTASSQSISQHRQYLGRAPDVVGGGSTGAKYACTLIFGRWFCEMKKQKPYKLFPLYLYKFHWFSLVQCIIMIYIIGILYKVVYEIH